MYPGSKLLNMLLTFYFLRFEVELLIYYMVFTENSYHFQSVKHFLSAHKIIYKFFFIIIIMYNQIFIFGWLWICSYAKPLIFRLLIIFAHYFWTVALFRIKNIVLRPIETIYEFFTTFFFFKTQVWSYVLKDDILGLHSKTWVSFPEIWVTYF